MQVNIRWKALDEIYKIYILLHRSDIKNQQNMSAVFNEKIEIRERCKGVHCVDLGESFPTNIYLQKSASIQPRTSLSRFGGKFYSSFIRLLSRAALRPLPPRRLEQWRPERVCAREAGPAFADGFDLTELHRVPETEHVL